MIQYVPNIIILLLPQEIVNKDLPLKGNPFRDEINDLSRLFARGPGLSGTGMILPSATVYGSLL